MSAAQLAIDAACKDPTIGSATRLAQMVGSLIGQTVAQGQVAQWQSGRRPITPKYARALEQLQVAPVWVLRPDDWYLIWPERIGAEGAPAAPEILLKRRRKNAGRTTEQSTVSRGTAAQ